MLPMTWQVDNEAPEDRFDIADLVSEIMHPFHGLLRPSMAFSDLSWPSLTFHGPL